MTMSGTKRVLLGVSLTVALSSGVAPGLLMAGDEENPIPPSKAAAIKPDAPAPGLTERERWLLDRVDQLERRVADLESKRDPAAASAAGAPAAEPVSANTAMSAVAVANPGITHTSNTANSNSLPNESVAVCGA